MKPAQSVRLLLVFLCSLIEYVPAAEGSKLGDSLCKLSVKLSVGHDVVVLTPDHLRCLSMPRSRIREAAVTRAEAGSFSSLMMVASVLMASAV
jgi:hypothetical protein